MGEGMLNISPFTVSRLPFVLSACSARSSLLSPSPLPQPNEKTERTTTSGKTNRSLKFFDIILAIFLSQILNPESDSYRGETGRDDLRVPKITFFCNQTQKM